MIPAILWKRRVAGAAAVLALLAAGCDSSGVGKTVPVVGKITVNGEPLTIDTAYVLFRPDRARGNNSPFEPAGAVDEEGNYTLSTKGKEGAPPGWYLVEVFASAPAAAGHPGKRTAASAAPVSIIDSKYNSVKTSGLAKEVVDHPGPGAYDLQLTKRERSRGTNAPALSRPRR
jgi:hypothetical protein